LCRRRVTAGGRHGRDDQPEVRYRRRIVDDELDELLVGLPAVTIDGPKAVGKTSYRASQNRLTGSAEQSTTGPHQGAS